jgi:hypothetical protein
MATINHKTYNEGTETFKDFSVYDGKDTLIFKVDGSEGNVGIGTSAPIYKLQVSDGNLGITGDSSPRLLLNNTSVSGLNYSIFSDDTGNLVIGRTGVADYVTVTSAGVLDLAEGQIKFPVTQVPSADPNTLDDYEEGTFTATLLGVGSNPTTPVTTTGAYTKIGRQVNVNVYFSGADTTGASGVAVVSGLPFTSANVAGITSGSASANLFDFGTGTSLQCYIAQSSTVIEFLASSDDTAWTSIQHNAGAGRALSANITYFV